MHNGKPNLKNMSKPEFNVFCKTLLDILVAEKQSQTEQSKKLDNKNFNCTANLCN